VGTCTPCDNYQDQQGCEEQLGCSWYPAVCSGIATPCETYSTQEECLAQAGCEWIGP